MKKTDQEAFTKYYDKVKMYLSMEYSELLAEKMELNKYINVCKGYLRNCYSLKKNVPYAANGLATYLNNSL